MLKNLNPTWKCKSHREVLHAANSVCQTRRNAGVSSDWWKSYLPRYTWEPSSDVPPKELFMCS